MSFNFGEFDKKVIAGAVIGFFGSSLMVSLMKQKLVLGVPASLLSSYTEFLFLSILFDMLFWLSASLVIIGSYYRLRLEKQHFVLSGALFVLVSPVWNIFSEVFMLGFPYPFFMEKHSVQAYWPSGTIQVGGLEPNRLVTGLTIDLVFSLIIILIVVWILRRLAIKPVPDLEE